MDSNKTAGEEDRRQLHKNAEQVLAATPTRHQLYGHLPPITKTIQVRRTRHAGHCWRSRDELISDVLLWTPTQKQDDQHEHTFSSYVRIRDVVLKTCLRRWTIGRSGERGSGISVLPARHDDDDDYYDNFRINFYLLRTFCPLLGSFFVLFLLSLRFGKFHLWPSSGDFTATSDWNDESCNRIPSNYCLP